MKDCKTYLLNSDTAYDLRGRLPHTALPMLIDSDISLESMPRNLFHCLMSEDCFHALGTPDAFLSDEALSDFERFERMIATLEDYAGSGYYRFVKLAFEHCTDNAGHPTSEECRALWKRFTETSSYAEADPERPMLVRVTELLPWFMQSNENMGSCETMAVFLSSYETVLRQKTLPMLRFTISRFRTPDPYHSSLAFDRIRERKATPEDREYHFAQMLRITGEMCLKYDRPLLLRVDTHHFSIDALTEAVGYLKRNRRMPNAVLIAVSFADTDALRTVFRSLKASGLTEELLGIIPLDLPFMSGATVLDALRLFGEELPLSRLFCFAEGKSLFEGRIHGEALIRLTCSYLTTLIQSGELSKEGSVSVATRLLRDNPAHLCQAIQENRLSVEKE